MIRISVILAMAFALFQFACATATKQGPNMILDTSQDDELGGTGTDSGDVKSMAERMAREISGIEWPAGSQVPRIAVLPLQNNTRFRIDPKLLQNKLVKDLVGFSRGKIAFLARDTENEVLAERSKKRSGMYDQGQKKGTLAGADYLLKGEMRSLTKATRGKVSDYIVYSFQLIDAETGALLWVGDYETKKLGDTGVVYQ